MQHVLHSSPTHRIHLHASWNNQEHRRRLRRPPHWVCVSDYFISEIFMDIPYIFLIYSIYIYICIFIYIYIYIYIYIPVNPLPGVETNGSFINCQWFHLVLLSAGCWLPGYLLATELLNAWSLVCHLIARQFRWIRWGLSFLWVTPHTLLVTPQFTSP